MAAHWMPDRKKLSTFIKRTRRLIVWVANAIHRPPEVSAALTALIAMRRQFETKNSFTEKAADDLFCEARRRITWQPGETIHAIAVEHIAPAHLILVLVSNLARTVLCSGELHAYKGLLSREGQGCMSVFKSTLAVMVQSGFAAEDQVRADLARVESEIRRLG